MKILFISDIHANLEALLSIEEEIKYADEIICVGDIVGYHCDVNEVIDFLKANNVYCIQGNHDRYVIEGLACQTKNINDAVRFGIEYAQKVISKENLDWLASLPLSIDFHFDNLHICCFHGSPWNPTEGYVYADSDLFKEMEELYANIIVLGHTHRAYKHKIAENKYVVNPGSVGQSRDIEGKACALFFDTLKFQFEDLVKDYNYNKTIQQAISLGAKDWIYKHFQPLI